MGSKGLHSGESTRLPPMWCGFKSRRRRHMWVQFVVGSLTPRGFSPGTPVFPSPQKTTSSKFQFDQKSGRRRTTLWICYPQNHYLFILFIYLSDAFASFYKGHWATGVYHGDAMLRQITESIKIRREGSINNKTEWNSITLPQAAIVK